MTLPPGVAAELEQLTTGWAPERRAALAARLREETARRAAAPAPRSFATPGGIAAYVDPTTRNPPHLQRIDQAYADIAAGRLNRLLIVMPPQEGKSSRCVQYGVPFLLHQHPDWRVGIATYSQREANRWGRHTRRVVRAHGGALGLALADHTGSTSMSDWELTAGGGVIAGGVPGGPWTGRPLDCLLIDDPLKGPEQADSEDHRERVWEWWTDVALGRLARLSSPVVCVQTRWHTDDLAGRFLVRDPELWRVIYVPAVAEEPAPDDPPWLVDALGRAPGVFLPSARPDRDPVFYERRRLAVGERTWSAQYQGRPSPREGGVFQWSWIAQGRVKVAPPLVRVAVAVDPNAGGSDEAGIVTAGRGQAGHVYVVDDRSGPYTIGGWARAAWLAVLDHEADVLVYERNLVPEVMQRALRSAWRRMREQAAALAVVPDADGDDTLLAVAASLAGRELADPEDPLTGDTADLAVMLAQLAEVRPYAARILEAPVAGPARLVGVSATRGKIARAEPMAQAAETGTYHHVGFHPELESQLTGWRPGQPSPGRLDAAVWAWYHLTSGGEAGSLAVPAGGRVPTGAGIASRRTTVGARTARGGFRR